jgi:phage terminase large subunit-like protein
MSHVAAALRYAEAVRDGEVLACKWVRLACERHLQDLARAESDPEYRFYFDEDAAELVCAFVEELPHTKGKWAAGTPGQPGGNRIRLEPWQKFVLSTLFGWKRVEDELRRFRVAYVEVPRKNGKSILAAGVGLYMFAADGEFGAEVYSGATSKYQAWEVFRPAKLMVERTPEFQAAYGAAAHASNLHILEDGSRFEPVIGKPGDGASPSCAIVDEYHEHPDDTLYDTMLTGMGAREQPLMFVITTAGENLEGACYALHLDVQKVLEGSIDNDELFGIIYTIDEGDDWTSEEALRKANPNYGVSIFGDFLQSQIADAVRSSRKQGIVKTKHLNVWVRARNAWMNMEAWKRQADPTLREEDFEGESCWSGLDLASKLDLTAAVKVFKRQETVSAGDGAEERTVDHFYVFGRYYLPEEAASDPKHRHYQGWARDGHLILTEGTVIDYARIRGDVAEDAERFHVAQLGIDPFGSTQLGQELQDDHGVEVVEIPQTVKYLSEPMKWVEAYTLAGQLHHDGNPVLTWAMSNVTARTDANDNVFPRKERKENKIDPVVALIMALGRALANGGADSGSVYDDRGILAW